MVFIDAEGFEKLIKTDTESSKNLFLVAVVQDRIVGFKIEGILKQDKIISDGKYHNTIIMGRFNDL